MQIAWPCIAVLRRVLRPSDVCAGRGATRGGWSSGGGSGCGRSGGGAGLGGGKGGSGCLLGGVSWAFCSWGDGRVGGGDWMGWDGVGLMGG